MLLGLAAWAISAAFILLVSFVIQRHLPTGRPALNLLSFLLLALFAITAYMIGIGLLGWLRPLPILISSAVGIGLITLSKPGRSAVLGIRGAFAEAWGMLGDWWSTIPRWLRWFTAIAAALSVVRFAFLIWALPPFVWDSLSYHLTNIAHWIQVGRIETFDVPVTRIYNPANYEVLASWFAVFLHHDVVIEAAGLPAYLLAAVAVYAIARGMRSSRAASLMGALAYASTPAVILAATGTKNDIHIAAYYLVALALVVDLANRPPSTSGRNSRSRLILLALAIMLAIGTKTYIVHLLPGLAVLGLSGGPEQRGWTRWRSHLRRAGRSVRSMVLESRAVLLAVVLAALFSASFWNVRNWLATGNPFYPYEVLIAGRSVFYGPESEFRLDVRELMANLENVAGKFGDWRDPIRPDLPNTTGWGWFAYVIGLPALGWALIRRSRTRPLVLCFGVSFLVLMLSTGPSPWNMRFAIWFPAVFALCFAELSDALPKYVPRMLAMSAGAYFAAILSLNFVGTLNYNRVSAEEFREMFQLSALERDSALFSDNMPQPYAYVNQTVPKDAILGFNTTGNGFVYPLYRADFSQLVVYVPFSLSDDCAAIAERMAARQTRYLMVAPEHTEDGKIALLDECAEHGGVIRERGRGLYVIDN